MRFDVPFLPDDGYVRLLSQNMEQIHSLHFSLGLASLPDARYILDKQSVNQTMDGLKTLPSARKYALLNGRFHTPETYLDRKSLAELLESLERLLSGNCISGIVFTDYYLLQSLSDAASSVCAELEAVPSVNCMLDSTDKISACLEIIEGTHFRLPGKLLLDRSLNRKIDELTDIASWVKTNRQDLQIGLLANEGCLYQCPFKMAHDSLIAASNMNMIAEHGYNINHHAGCKKIIQDKPFLFFKSPFIRPEDVDRYEPAADIIKICGRTLGPGFLKKTVGAYLSRRFDGNILELMDATSWLAQMIHIDNRMIPDNFLEKLKYCDKTCRACNYCELLFNHTSSTVGASLPIFR